MVPGQEEQLTEVLPDQPGGESASGRLIAVQVVDQPRDGTGRIHRKKSPERNAFSPGPLQYLRPLNFQIKKPPDNPTACSIERNPQVSCDLKPLAVRNQKESRDVGF